MKYIKLALIIILLKFSNVFAAQYDGIAAARYAKNHYDTFSYNPIYPDYPKDCTNFVSQILTAGGLSWKPTDTNIFPSGEGAKYSDINYWFIKLNDSTILFWDRYVTRSLSWSTVNGLYSHLRNRPENEVEFTGGNTSKLSYGDVVMFDWENDNILDHAMIVVATSPIKLSGHSNNVYGVLLSDILSRQNTPPRVIGFHIKGKTYDFVPNKKSNSIALTLNSTTTASNWLSRTLNTTFAFLGIRDAVAQSLPSLFAYINQPYTVRVDGTGFDGNEAVSIDGSTCTASTIQRGSGYFTQSCTGGSAAGDANKIRVYDTQYDLDIEVPTAYQTMQLRGPVIAPLAPALTEPTTGTIRLSWSAVSGATGYEVSRGGVAINTVGTTTSYDDAGRTAGTPYCYRLRTIQGGIMSAYSPEACYTPATIKCSGTWNNTQYSVGVTETTTQACQAGYTGNKTLSHTCQASGQWGATTTQDNCTLTPAPTCTGSWSSAKYLVGQTEEKNENTCPAGTQGQVRSWHTCQASGSSAVWGGLSQSDNCTAYLATPTGIYASSVSGGVQITWDGVSGATSYNLYKSGSLYRSNITSTSYVDSYVTNGVTYSYSVSAYSNYNGQNATSPVSGSYSVVYRDGQTGVSPPTNVSAAQYNQYSQKGIRLTWSGAANADSYFVYRRGYSNPYTSATYLAPVGGGDISFTDWVTPGFSGGVITGQSYCYYIRSGRGSVKSTESNEACAMAP